MLDVMDGACPQIVEKVLPTFPEAEKVREAVLTVAIALIIFSMSPLHLLI